MDETEGSWWLLHLRAARGEELTPEERAVYEAALQRLDASESYSGDLALLQRTRGRITALQAEQAELKARHDALSAQIAALEAALDERTRQALGLTAAASDIG